MSGVTQERIDIGPYLGGGALAPDRTAYTSMLMEKLDDMDSEPNEITELISVDPVLVSKILTLANSAWIAARKNSSNVWDAVTVLGFGMVRNVAAINLLAMKPDNAELPPGYFDHAIMSAAGAAAIADHVGAKARDSWSIALMHDLGALLMASVHGSAWSDCKGDDDFVSVAAERGAFGFSHDELGAEVLAHLRLPTVVTNSVREHNECPSVSSSPISLCVRGGIALAESLGSVGCSQPIGDHQPFLAELDIVGQDRVLETKLDEHMSSLRALLS